MFRYPLDGNEILRKKRQLRRLLLEKDNLLPKRIALLSGSTIGEISGILELFLLDSGIKPLFHIGAFNRYYEDLVFSNPTLTEFAPEIIYIHISIHNIEEFPSPGDSPEVRAEIRAGEWDKLSRLLVAAQQYNCPVIINNFELPSIRIMGNRDAYDVNGRVRFITELNLMLADYAAGHDYIYINDINYLSGWFGLEQWADPGYYNAYKYAVAPEAIPLLCLSISSIIKALFGGNKKALMLDLDNTLWNGVIGDDGVEGILIGAETPKGMAHAEIQKYAKELRRVGILLGVISKNDEALAKEGFTHPSSILTEADFSVFLANWDEKRINLQQAADSLNIGTDSFVFVDDNPVERERILESELSVEVASFKSIERLPQTLSMSGYFEVVSLSDDDLKRAEMYSENRMRENAIKEFSDYSEYLKSLEMKAYLSGFSTERRERITQLINKTNQFNTTTRRYTAEEISVVAGDERYIKIAARLTDRFGDNGLVCVLIAELKDHKAIIDLFIMSCRVFGRDLEYILFDELIRQVTAKGVDTIEGIYIPTKKNTVIEKLFCQLGFTEVESLPESIRYEFSLNDSQARETDTIEVIYE